MATTLILKRKLYTKWDETDNLKRMKDSDILAEKPKQGGNKADVVRDTALGVAGGATLGAGAGLTYGLLKGGNAGAMFKKGGKAGAILGGLSLGAKALKKVNDKDKDAEFYNKRLAYAQKQALRREKKDWKTNMTQRDGYSY
jgi:hypothetical protein